MIPFGGIIQMTLGSIPMEGRGVDAMGIDMTDFSVPEGGGLCFPACMRDMLKLAGIDVLDGRPPELPVGVSLNQLTTHDGAQGSDAETPSGEPAETGSDRSTEIASELVVPADLIAALSQPVAAMSHMSQPVGDDILASPTAGQDPTETRHSQGTQPVTPPIDQPHRPADLVVQLPGSSPETKIDPTLHSAQPTTASDFSAPMKPGIVADASGREPAPLAPTPPTGLEAPVDVNAAAQQPDGRRPAASAVLSQRWSSEAGPARPENAAPLHSTMDVNTFRQPATPVDVRQGDGRQTPDRRQGMTTPAVDPAINVEKGAGEERAVNRLWNVRQAEPSPVDQAPLTSSPASDLIPSNTVDASKMPPVLQASTNTPALEPPAAAQASAGPAESADRSFQATVMEQIVERAALRSIRGRSEVQIRLKPEFLGNVQMNITADKDQLIVRILTDRPVVKEIIETHLHQLKAELHNQGVSIDRFDISVNPDADQPHHRDQFSQTPRQSSFQQGHRQNGRDPDPEGNDDTGQWRPDNERSTSDGVNYFA